MNTGKLILGKYQIIPNINILKLEYERRCICGEKYGNIYQ